MNKEEQSLPYRYPLDLALQFMVHGYQPIELNKARIAYKNQSVVSDKLISAQKEMQDFLLSGKIKSWYSRMYDAYEDTETKEQEPMPLNACYWNGEVDWEGLSVRSVNKIYKVDISFYDIFVCTRDLTFHCSIREEETE